MPHLLDGKGLAATLQAETAAAVQSFRQRTGVQPLLHAILVGEDPASSIYVGNKEKACSAVGMQSRLTRLPSTTSQAELLEVLKASNSDPAVHGILVQLPLPAGIAKEAVLDAIDPRKDVDAFHAENLGRLMQGRPRFLPCTPAGVCEILHREKLPVSGRRVVIVGRSEIVGKPLAAMLLQRGADATVTVCHSRTKDLASVTQTAEILVAAIGQPQFITAEMIQPGCIVVDVGINRLGKRVVGDVDFEHVSQISGPITPVPGGIGPLTVAMLMKNTLKAAELQQQG